MVASMVSGINNRLLSESSISAQELSLSKALLFGTDGIRGKVGDLLTAPFALQLGFWAGQILRENSLLSGPVFIGQDSRNSSDMLAMAIAAGLTSAGLEVWQLGLCPTPCVAHLAGRMDAIGGIMISASHNPPEDNGIKFFNAEGLKLGKTQTQRIEAGLRGQIPSSVENSSPYGKAFHKPNMVNYYGHFLLNGLPADIDFSGMRIVLDLAWGASVLIAPEMFRVMGAEVICLHDQPNGDRINVDCGSTNLTALKQAVKKHRADIGFAFNGDADRVMAVDNKGKSIDGDYILYLWGKTLKERQELPDNLIIGTVMANLGFERAWQKLGGTLVRTAVGDQHVQAHMWETGAMLGGEQSGHIICHHHSFSGDGVQAALHLTSLVQQSGLSLSELLEESFHPYPQILRNVRVEDRDRRLNWQDCDVLQNAIVRAKMAMGADRRILVRASGTEPVIRVMVESASADDAEHWTSELIKVVQTQFAA